MSNQYRNSRQISSQKTPLHSTNSNQTSGSVPKIKKFPTGGSNPDIYAEDINYQIESTSKLNTEEKNLNFLNFNNHPNSYIERLENKIQEQAKRLTEMRNYIHLCEKKIKQLNPDEILPLSADGFNTRLTTGGDRYDQLYKKYTKLLKDFNELISKDKSDKIEGVSVVQEKYKNLKKKYRDLMDEKNKVIELLRQETLNSEEQKNVIAILQQTIDNDLAKNGTIAKYTKDDIIDLTKLKAESENYRKQLVLSQALVNSLKAEIDSLHQAESKRKKGQVTQTESINSSMIGNIKETVNNSSSGTKPNQNNALNTIVTNNSNNGPTKEEIQNSSAIKSTLNSQMQIISNLQAENANLKQLIDEAENKINENVEANSTTSTKLREISNELEIKKGEITEYESKFDYFNEYISQMKLALKKLQINIGKYISIYNTMANDDLNSLLSKTFSENIANLLNKNNQIKQVEKYSLNMNDVEIFNSVNSLLNAVHKEFVIIYEKIFQSNDVYTESTKRIEALEKRVREGEETNAKINQVVSENNNVKNYNTELSRKVNSLLKDKDGLSKIMTLLRKEKDNLISLSQTLMKMSLFDNKLKIYQEAVNICETITKLEEERAHVKDKIDSLNANKIEYNKSNEELFNMVQKEHNTLILLYEEFGHKIEEKNNRLNEIKKELNEYINGVLNQNGNLINGVMLSLIHI